MKDTVLRENVVPEGTFLHMATKLGLQDAVRSLLMNGADPTVENGSGENAYELVNSVQIQQVYVEELLRATAGSKLVKKNKRLYYILEDYSVLTE